MKIDQETERTPIEARQAERVGLIWILTASLLLSIMGVGAVLLFQAL